MWSQIHSLEFFGRNFERTVFERTASSENRNHVLQKGQFDNIKIHRLSKIGNLNDRFAINEKNLFSSLHYNQAQFFILKVSKFRIVLIYLKNSKIIIKLIMNAASNLYWAGKIILNIHLGTVVLNWTHHFERLKKYSNHNLTNLTGHPVPSLNKGFRPLTCHSNPPIALPIVYSD
jgi:hypothetical protein